MLYLTYHNKKWIASTRRIVKINDSSLIGKVPVIEKLNSLLGQCGLALGELDVKCRFVFHISCTEYSVIAAKDSISLVECYHNELKRSLINEKVYESIPRLPSIVPENLQQSVAELVESCRKQPISAVVCIASYNYTDNGVKYADTCHFEL